MIRLEDLTKIFETPSGDIIAADRINMEVPDGNICVLLGPSGCGKTTTMKMVNRLVEPTSGKIFIGDEDVTSKDPIQLRRNIGYVIQQIGLLFDHPAFAHFADTVPNRRLGTAHQLGNIIQRQPAIALQLVEDFPIKIVQAD